MKITLTHDLVNIINPNKYKIIFLDEYLSNENEKYDALFIDYTRTPMISYKHMCNDLYGVHTNGTEVINKIRSFNGLRVLLIHDIHNYTFDRGYATFYMGCQLLKIDHVISNYCDNNEFNIIKRMTDKLGIGISIVPNLINENIFYDHGEEKIYDILIYGMDIMPCYHFRKRLKNLLIENQNKWKVRIIQYNEKKGIELSKEINKSYLAIATCSSFNYFLFKYAEICLSHTYLVGNMSEQGKEYFKPNDYLDINEKMSDEEITNKIDQCLQNKDSLKYKCQQQACNIEFLKDKYKYYYYVIILDKLLNKEN